MCVREAERCTRAAAACSKINIEIKNQGPRPKSHIPHEGPGEIRKEEGAKEERRKGASSKQGARRPEAGSLAGFKILDSINRQGTPQNNTKFIDELRPAGCLVFLHSVLCFLLSSCYSGLYKTAGNTRQPGTLAV